MLLGWGLVVKPGRFGEVVPLELGSLIRQVPVVLVISVVAPFV